MIGIIDYGMGNLYSVSKALERLGYDYFVSEEEEELSKATGLLLPGVGSFRDAMAILNETGLKAFIDKEVVAGKPLLGICLGMQLLFEESNENGFAEGFSFLPGKVKKFPGQDSFGKSYKVPHMGWNKLDIKKPDSFLMNDVGNEHVYFVHSYYVDTQDRDVLIASANYAEEVPAVVGKGKVFGTQFHPEKSSHAGLAILRNYAQYVERNDS
ncbi:imidazole glycerol phosphate synthase subunit HisH [Pseudalkalibacillus hwajinpoensis]|uniref:Imidazole glycerol phosphate synthase subunit HisH n=1 Tax=Guptibacillus hwajinpoensis TaxID=208199 RepID=A0A4U1MI60_9BACL|nr:imidazole glycerol phosphate synthase subunit HisH [Pseudalkalibacillus hwajinpoensis]TKD71019.1 imidazole glycerol phosphate synthase subunit HisH [Pseudalkalibacillus hwajinpoensis]